MGAKKRFRDVISNLSSTGPSNMTKETNVT